MTGISAIRNELRRRVVAASGVDFSTQFVANNEIENPDGQPVWLSESVDGGTHSRLTNMRGRLPDLRIQYDLYTKAGVGMDAADEKVDAILAEFDEDGSDVDRLEIAANGATAVIVSIKHLSGADRNWRRDTILFTVSVVSG